MLRNNDLCDFGDVKNDDFGVVNQKTNVLSFSKSYILSKLVGGNDWGLD